MRLRELLDYDKKVIFIGFSKHRAFFKHKSNYTFIGWKDVSVMEDTGDITLGGKDVATYDFFFIGAMGKSRSKGAAIIDYAKKNHRTYLSYGSLTEDSKVVQHDTFIQRGFKHPKTVSGLKQEQDAQNLKQQLGLPIVIKPEHGEQGKGVIKVKTLKELKEFLDQVDKKRYVFQEFLENDGDYRLFFFKHRLLFAIKRMSQDKNEFRNNISLGGKQVFISLPTDVVEFASKVDKEFGLDFSGIDLIEHEGEWHVLEVNSSPQFIDKEKYVIPAITKYIDRL